jgi:hypothetical protein
MSISKEVIDSLARHAVTDEDFLKNLLDCNNESELKCLIGGSGNDDEFDHLSDIFKNSPSREMIDLELKSRELIEAIEHDWKARMAGAVFTGVC